METNVKDGAVAQRLDELFDVVDAQDQVIGRETRGDVHRRRLRHRAVHALVFGADGRVFLQKRSMKKDTAPGRWDSSCSGHLDAGEDYDVAVVRELAEEIGVELDTPPERWLRLEACAETGWEFVWVYRLRHDGPFRLHPAEIEEGQWFEVSEVSRMIQAEPKRFARAFTFVWKRLGLA